MECNMVATAISWLCVLFAALIAIPTAVFCWEIVAALWRPNLRSSALRDRRQSVAVLVPAHNESGGIVPTLENIKKQLRPGERLVVVADNCIDDTAKVARAAGGEVIERQDPNRIGKGYALDFGLRYLDNNPPDIVVMVDADCWLAADAIASLAAACLKSGRPAQALYLMYVPVGATVNKQIAGFAWRVKNWVRPLGLHNLGLPCQLTGTGMAFPWKVIRSVDLASGWIVEDLKLGLDLAAAGFPPLSCPSAHVTSQFATTEMASAIQRSRWEHGHIATIAKLAPRLLLTAISQGNLSLLALTLDLAVPPLSLLALLLVSIFIISGLAALMGLSVTPLAISAASLIAFSTIIVLAWNQSGRDVLPAHAISSIPFYIASKMGLYGRLLVGRNTARWIRTDRTKD
jgi:cellulose synthase/poly-beta-1,6-N-acetylglucosamine synthase-like glycosyltransferase